MAIRPSDMQVSRSEDPIELFGLTLISLNFPTGVRAVFEICYFVKGRNSQGSLNAIWAI